MKALSGFIDLTAARSRALLAAALAGAALPAAAPAVATSYSVVYAFTGPASSDGAFPYSPLLNIGGTLYGTTQQGGANGLGTFFSVTTGGLETPLDSFKGGSDDGSYPYGTPANVHGTLYGSTQAGGASGVGTLYTATAGANSEQLLYSFKGGSNDGANPFRDPLAVGKNLYGTTILGGVYNGGTVYSISKTGTPNWIYSFHNTTADGGTPYSHLIKVGSLLYGTTYRGGTSGCGTVFSITTQGVENVVYSFTGGADGCWPLAGLTYVKPYLYGTTSIAGEGGGCRNMGGCGSVYSLDPANPTNVRWSYGLQGGSAGAQPGYGALLRVGGMLYGSTAQGGGTGCAGGSCGTLFSISTEGTGYSVIHAFQGGPSDGFYPQGELSRVNGTLYGTTVFGGNTLCSGNGCGTVFSLTP